MATMPSQDYYAPAEVPDFDISLFPSYEHTQDQQQWPHNNYCAFPTVDVKQDLNHIPVPKIEHPDQFEYLDNPWQWGPPPTAQAHHHLPPMNGMPMASPYQQTGSPINNQLQPPVSDPPTPAAECQVTSTNLSPLQLHSPYSPHSDVGSYDGSYLPGEMPSHFDNTELNEVNIKGLTEEQLVSLTARDLNRICREMPEDIVKQLKKRRRTLKNRGYAYNSRVRRVSQKTALEAERDDLKQQIQQLTERCRALEREANSWKRRAQTLERGQIS